MNKGAKHMAIQHFYIFSATAAVHLLCCVETRPDLTLWARPLTDAHYRNQANVSLVHRSREGLAPKAWGGEEHERQHGCRGIGRHSLQAVAAISWQYETRAVEAHVVRGHAERGREARVRRARGDTAGARVDVREDKITGDHLIG